MWEVDLPPGMNISEKWGKCFGIGESKPVLSALSYFLSERLRVCSVCVAIINCLLFDLVRRFYGVT